jgi:hypothetical protein
LKHTSPIPKINAYIHFIHLQTKSSKKGEEIRMGIEILKKKMKHASEPVVKESELPEKDQILIHQIKERTR